MTPNEYLAKVLSIQTLASDSPALKDLQERRVEVEEHLCEHFGDSSPTLRYGGSKAKGTMIKESYDLDVVCYFSHDDTAGGETLEDIYNSVREALDEKYLVQLKSSALRLRDASAMTHGADFHIDVVPGRFSDEKEADTFLYISSGEKKRLKTNLDVHIAHVKESGVTGAIRLMKLWKVRARVSVRNFILELAVIKLLSSKKAVALATQLEHIWTELRDNIDDLTVEDPANPTGNDLSDLLNAAKYELSTAARHTLDLIERSGWEAVYGPVEEEDHSKNMAALRRAAAVATPTRAWCRNA